MMVKLCMLAILFPFKLPVSNNSALCPQLSIEDQITNTYEYCKYLWNYNTDQHEISGQYFDNENMSGDAVLWRHNKSKMADGRQFEDR